MCGIVSDNSTGTLKGCVSTGRYPRDKSSCSRIFDSRCELNDACKVITSHEAGYREGEEGDALKEGEKELEAWVVPTVAGLSLLVLALGAALVWTCVSRQSSGAPGQSERPRTASTAAYYARPRRRSTAVSRRGTQGRRLTQHY